MLLLIEAKERLWRSEGWGDLHVFCGSKAAFLLRARRGVYSLIEACRETEGSSWVQASPVMSWQWHHNGVWQLVQPRHDHIWGFRHTAPPRIHHEAIQSELWKTNGGEHNSTGHIWIFSHQTGVIDRVWKRKEESVGSPIQSNDVQSPSGTKWRCGPWIRTGPW